MMMTFTTMTMMNIALALLILLPTTTTPSAVVALDQYQPDNGINAEATDFNNGIQKSSQHLHHHQQHPYRSHHRFDFSGNKMKTVPELQVGCADGNIVEQTQSPPQISIKKAEGGSSGGSFRRNKRKIRSYNNWPEKVQLPVNYPSISYWKAQTYQLARPYFIPIYGAPGHIPIYYPPQPLLINPGSPIDNPPPKVPYQGPTYLPPGPDTTTMKTINRFGEDDDDARPIWDGNNNNNNNRITPTRRPRPQGGGLRPPITPPEVPPLRVPGPSPCVWAIISCCSTAGEIRYDCFEQRGCSGAFWDKNPCDNDFARAAIASALNYYNTNQK